MTLAINARSLDALDRGSSTPHLLTALVEEAVSVRALVRLLQFAQGQARLVEVILADDAPVKGQPLSAIGMPPDATIVAVVRNQRVVVPRDDTPHPDRTTARVPRKSAIRSFVPTVSLPLGTPNLW